MRVWRCRRGERRAGGAKPTRAGGAPGKMGRQSGRQSGPPMHTRSAKMQNTMAKLRALQRGSTKCLPSAKIACALAPSLHRARTYLPSKPHVVHPFAFIDNSVHAHVHHHDLLARPRSTGVSRHAPATRGSSRVACKSGARGYGAGICAACRNSEYAPSPTTCTVSHCTCHCVAQSSRAVPACVCDCSL